MIIYQMIFWYYKTIFFSLTIADIAINYVKTTLAKTNTKIKCESARLVWNKPLFRYF